jgi:hypothetical protein
MINDDGVLEAQTSVYEHPNFTNDSGNYRFQKYLIYEVLDGYLPERFCKADFFRPQEEYPVNEFTESYVSYLLNMEEEFMASQVYVNALVDFRDDNDFMRHVDLRVYGRGDVLSYPVQQGFLYRRAILSSLGKE